MSFPTLPTRLDGAELALRDLPPDSAGVDFVPLLECTFEPVSSRVSPFGP